MRSYVVVLPFLALSLRAFADPAPTSVFYNSVTREALVGQPLTLSVGVNKSGPATLTGTVTFRVGATTLAAAPVNNNRADAQTTFATAGVRTIVAEYSGDANFQPSSTSLDFTILNPAAKVTSISPTSFTGGTESHAMTLEGENFLAGANLTASAASATVGSVTIVSSTRITFTLQYAPTAVTDLFVFVGNPSPAQIGSQTAAKVHVSAVLSDLSPVVFDRTTNTVTARVTPGADTFWISGGIANSQSFTQAASKNFAVRDTDGDGVVSWSYGSELPRIATYVVADSAGLLRLAHLPEWDSTQPFDVRLELGPSGKLSRLVTRQALMAAFLWVRPGVGGWRDFILDATPADQDIPGAGNNRIVELTEKMAPFAGYPAAPDSFQPGDILVALDLLTHGVYARALPGSIAPTLGPGTFEVYPSASNDLNTETSPIKVWLYRDQGSDGTVSIDYATADDTARAGLDYVATSGRLMFGPGEYLKNFSIPLLDDGVYAGRRTVKVDFVPSGTSLFGGNSALFTFRDNDPPPVFSISDVTVEEGDAGTRVATLNVTLGGPTRVPSQVIWNVLNDSQSGLLVFAPGETSKTISINYQGNAQPGADRTLQVNLNNPIDATIGKGSGTITILDDDTPRLTVDDVSANEGSVAHFVVKLLKASPSPVSVNYATVSGTATSGTDFAAASGTLTFAPGETSKTVDVPVLNDAVTESAETFAFTLSGASGATIARSTATGTIIDVAAPLPAIAVLDASIVEGNAISLMPRVNVVLTLSAPSAQAVSVDYLTVNGTATGGSLATTVRPDYVTTSGHAVFAPGQTTTSIEIIIVPDSSFEPDETFFVVLSAPVNATLGRDRATVTIVNDDDDLESLVFSVSDVRVVEGNSGTTTATFKFQLSHPLIRSTYIAVWETADGTAMKGADYVAASGVVTFEPGETTKDVNVKVIGDTLTEGNETFVVRFPIGGGGFVPFVGTCTIVDDDGPLIPARRRPSRH